jgi:protein-tyrosine phosphatase
MDGITESLFVGDSEDAGDTARYRAHGIEHVVGLTHTPPDGGYPDGVTVTRVPLYDGPRNDFENFATAVTATLSALDDGERVLVHCSAGTSRSVSVAATVLARRRATSYEAALQTVQRGRDTDVDPHPALVERGLSILGSDKAFEAVDPERIPLEPDREDD